MFFTSVLRPTWFAVYRNMRMDPEVYSQESISVTSWFISKFFKTLRMPSIEKSNWNGGIENGRGTWLIQRIQDGRTWALNWKPILSFEIPGQARNDNRRVKPGMTIAGSSPDCPIGPADRGRDVSFNRQKRKEAGITYLAVSLRKSANRAILHFSPLL